jgi:hypothetical protein
MIKDRSNDQKQIAQNRQHLHTPKLTLDYTTKARLLRVSDANPFLGQVAR